MTKPMKWLLGGFIALSGFHPVHAANILSQLPVNATVTPGCTSLSVTGMNFGAVPASSGKFDTTATITVTCVQGVPYFINLGNGNNAPLLQNQRRMIDGAGNFMNYSISVDAAHTTGWYDGKALGTANQSGTGNGAAQAFTAYGETAPVTSQPAGSYADLVDVALNF